VPDPPSHLPIHRDHAGPGRNPARRAGLRRARADSPIRPPARFPTRPRHVGAPIAYHCAVLPDNRKERPMDDDNNLAEGAELALREAAANLTEQLAALDQAITAHEARARELRETRKRVLRVQAIVEGTDGRQNNGGSPGPRNLANVSEATKRRHAEMRAAKKARVAEYVETRDGLHDIRAVDVADALNDPTQPKNHPARLGTGLANDLLRELRDEGVLRLDRTGAGGQSYYRRVMPPAEAGVGRE